MFRGLLTAGWAFVLFIFTATSSLEELANQHKIQFKLVNSPDFLQFLQPFPDQIDTPFVLQKIGHSVSFFILTILLLSWVNSGKKAGIIAFLYAALTEILQIYFGRDGRLFDLGFDAAGIGIALIFGLIYSLFKGAQKKKTVNEENLL